MISVRNHRQPLNGNRFLLIALALFITFSSCDLLDKLPVKPHTDNPDGNDTIVVVNPVDTVTSEIDTVIKEGKIIRKKVYKIAIMLPFSIDDSYINNFDYKDRTTPYHSLMSTEMYEGMLLALEDIDRGKGDFEIFVYDTKNSGTEIGRILKIPELKTMDLIIGPLFKHNLELVSAFSQQNKILMLSPLVSVSGLKHWNPYFIATNATLYSHMKSMAAFIGVQYPHHKVFIISPSSGAENKYRDVMNEDLKSTPKSYLDIHQISSNDGNDLSANEFSVFDTTIVIIPSNDEVFTHNALRTLNSENEEHPMIVFGMPNWLSKFNSIPYNYLNNLHFHFSSSLWINPDRKGATSFNQRYSNTYGIYPSKYAVKGYDLMLWTTRLFHKYGISTKKHLNDISLAEMNCPFDLKAFDENNIPVAGHTNVNYYRNTYVHILRMNQYRLIKVNN